MSSRRGGVPPEIKLDLVEDGPSSSHGRPMSAPSPFDVNIRQNERKGSADFRLSVSSVLQDIESRQSANDERKLQVLLANMKKVKSSTLFQMLVVTFVFHLCVYVADVVTDIVNGDHHSRTGKNEGITNSSFIQTIIRYSLYLHYILLKAENGLILDIIVVILKAYFC